MNQLVDSQGNFLPHLLPVDQTLHWANPPGPRDSRGTNPNPYAGPVPMVTHVHGAHATQDSDGYGEAWYLPKAKNIPAGYFKTGTFYETFKGLSILGNLWSAGTAVFQYANDQRASTIWYHDHTLGMTRLNVYAGPAGFYLLRGGAGDQVGGTLPGPAPGVGADPFGTYYEIPIAIQDRSFKRIGKIRHVAASKIGGLPPWIPAVGCWWGAPSVRRIGFEGYEVKGDEVDRSLAMKGTRRAQNRWHCPGRKAGSEAVSRMRRLRERDGCLGEDLATVYFVYSSAREFLR
jgi:bilirubin oxidase